MDIKKLQYIITISECKSISKAAEKLYISQSGLNQQLNKIEKELGTVLFERTTHSLKITEAGRIMVRYAEESINHEKRVRMMLKDLTDGLSGEIRVNLAMEQGAQLLCRIYPEFHRKYPGIVLRLMDSKVQEQYDLLLKDQLDIGMVMICERTQPEIEYIHLTYERLLLGVPINHPFAAQYSLTEEGDYPSIDLALCREEEFSLMFSGSTFRQAVAPAFVEAGFEPKILFEARGNHILALMVQSGLCLTILPESQARLYQNICWFKIHSNPYWESCMIYHKENPPRKAGRYFIELAVESYKKDGNTLFPGEAYTLKNKK